MFYRETFCTMVIDTFVYTIYRAAELSFAKTYTQGHWIPVIVIDVLNTGENFSLQSVFFFKTLPSSCS